MAVVEIFVTAFVTVLIEKLASHMLLKMARLEGIHTHLKKWSITLAIIQAVLNDAEEKQITEKAVQTWLEDLQHLAYDLDDILDDLLTEALRRESVKATQEASTSKVRRLIPTCCTSFPSPCALKFHYNMGSKLEKITEGLQDLLTRKQYLGLRENVMGIKSYRIGERETTFLVNESHVYGRENDKKEVIKLLLRNETRAGEVSVISIIGMGGVGKTTLAQLVYNDDEVQGRFDLKIWVCVSDEFDVFPITTRILGATALNLNEAQEKLKKKLSNRKFLLVLDDVWNEDYGKWDQLRTPFLVGAPGSIVIVTTRNEKVVSTMGKVRGNDQMYRLDKLSDDICLSILARHALSTGDFEENPNFKIVAEKLARKCKGLPLAAKAIGGLLRTSGTANEWEDILNSKIWELPEQSTGILPALRLSYRHLPPHLKRLFAYCSIFPTDYVFDKYELVLLWMAEGFLQQSEGKKRMEEMGFLYFNELVSRSFFQPLSGSKESLFVMHDLMNDLAQFVARGICYRVEDEMKCNGQHMVFEKARHSSYIRQEYGVFNKFENYHKLLSLRTFLPLPVHKAEDWQQFYLSSRVVNELLPELRCLRVLSLSGYSITELSNSIGELKHLRYLNLSQTLITHLPESVSDLYNLQTLSLRNCSELCMLPTRIGGLVTLRHLDIGDTEKLLNMPSWIGKLTSLQTLSKIILDENNTLALTELRGLSDLRGTLAIIGLHNVMNVEDAREANLLSKQGLQDLTLTWSSDFDDSRRVETREYGVLEFLKPYTKLTKLKIEFYGGIEFPSWVCDPSFVDVTNLTLSGCERVASLPSLGHLPSLKELFIQGMVGVKNVGNELYGVGQVVAFKSLETLKFENMVGWEEWSFNLANIDDRVGAFPRLHNLTIRDCPELVKISLPNLPSLRVLDIRRCEEVVLRGIVSVASLTTITMEGILGLSKLHEEVVRSLGELQYLDIQNCDELRYLWEEEESSSHKLGKLVDLCFNCCPKLEKLPDLESCLPFLKKLNIYDCPRLQSLQTTKNLPTKENELIESNSSHHVESCSHLESLSIWVCDSLPCFLPGHNLPTTLKSLFVFLCPNLEPDSENFWLLNSSSMPSSLETIEIWNWVKLASLPRCLFNFIHLTDLSLCGCPGLESFPERGLPPNLRRLKIHNCENLKYLPDDQMQSLTSLVMLQIAGCPCLESFPQGRWPPNLETISIGNIKKQPISKWGLHRLPTSLVDFGILGDISGLTSFSGVGIKLPTSLTSLHIIDLHSIESLSMGLENLTLLQHLRISECPKLQSLPDTLLPTLSSLAIWKCPLLEERCLKEKRDYWPKISHIPCVMKSLIEPLLLLNVAGCLSPSPLPINTISSLRTCSLAPRSKSPRPHLILVQIPRSTPVRTVQRRRAHDCA
ncbi:hypothetical protein LguiA_033526 [Lonicera macranthoides]